jgi:hypothetical protein
MGASRPLTAPTPPAWSPTDLPSQKVWLRPDLGRTVNGDGKVTALLNQFGGGTFAPPTVGQEPPYVADGELGPAVAMTGNASMSLRWASSGVVTTAGTAFSVVSVAYLPNAIDRFRVWDTYSDLGQGMVAQHFEPNGVFYTFYEAFHASGVTVTAPGPIVLESYYDGAGTLRQFLNGVEGAQATGKTPTRAPMVNMYIGGSYAYAWQFNEGLWLAESILGTEHRTELHAYIADRYGVEL